MLHLSMLTILQGLRQFRYRMCNGFIVDLVCGTRVNATATGIRTVMQKRNKNACKLF